MQMLRIKFVLAGLFAGVCWWQLQATASEQANDVPMTRADFSGWQTVSHITYARDPADPRSP